MGDVARNAGGLVRPPSISRPRAGRHRARIVCGTIEGLQNGLELTKDAAAGRHRDRAEGEQRVFARRRSVKFAVGDDVDVH